MLPLSRGASNLASNKEGVSYIASLDTGVLYITYTVSCHMKKCCLLFRKTKLSYPPAIILVFDSAKFTNL